MRTPFAWRCSLFGDLRACRGHLTLLLAGLVDYACRRGNCVSGSVSHNRQLPRCRARSVNRYGLLCCCDAAACSSRPAFGSHAQDARIKGGGHWTHPGTLYLCFPCRGRTSTGEGRQRPSPPPRHCALLPMVDIRPCGSAARYFCLLCGRPGACASQPCA